MRLLGRVRGWTTGALACAVAAGCASRERREISAEDFRAPRTVPAVSSSVYRSFGPPSDPLDPASPEPFPAITRAEALGKAESLDVSQPTNEPETPTSPVGGPILVDAIVGDANGRPVFVSDILGRVEGELRTKAGELTPAQWRVEAARLIRGELNVFVEEELVVAEAYELLPAPQRVEGIAQWLNRVTEDFASQSRGSLALAQKRLREQEGITQEQWLANRKQRGLISFFLERRVFSRVFVTWRDVRLAYERNIDEFVKKPTASFRMIRVPADRAEDVASISTALDAGSFESAARSDANTFKRDEGGKIETTFTDPYESATLFGIDAINQAARGLFPGGRAGPIVDGGVVTWITLEAVTRDETPLRDAQLSIIQALGEQRKREELQKFMTRLKARASYSSIDEMTAVLVEAAAAKFLP